MRRITRAGAVAAGSAAVASAAAGQTWTEVGDAGELPSTAQTVKGSGSVTEIRGRHGDEDTDMFRITIANPALFSATTTNRVEWDTQLWLFRPDGTGVTFNDDEEAGFSLQSTLTNRFVFTAGEYLLAISQYDRDALDANSDEIWEDFPFGEERAPDGPGAASPVTQWDFGFTFEDKDYVIALSGCEFFGEPCYADCDTSTGVGVLDVFDFLCFQNRYDVGARYACDCDTSTGSGVCDVFDFLCFQNAYAAGCP